MARIKTRRRWGRPPWIIGALVASAGLLAATAAGYDSVTGRALPRAAPDVAEPLGRTELCAALILADGRQAAARLARGEAAGGAEFAGRNDQFRADWLLQELASADPTQDWRARANRLADKVPAGPEDSGYAEAGRAYVDCLQKQNSDAAFTAALHQAFGYQDLP